MARPARRTLVLGVLGLALLAAAITACSKGSTKPPPVALELDSGNITSGSSYPHTFANPGNYPYCCAIHGCSKMSGSVAVANGQPASAAVSIVNYAFNPQNVSVAPGGTVTWTNNSGGTTHTVTSQ
jgi:plastocyanin